MNLSILGITCSSVYLILFLYNYNIKNVNKSVPYFQEISNSSSICICIQTQCILRLTSFTFAYLYPYIISSQIESSLTFQKLMLTIINIPDYTFLCIYILLFMVWAEALFLV